MIDRKRDKMMTEKEHLETLNTIDHIAIQVNDIEQSISWYKEHFKCVVEYQDKSWAFIRFSNIALALVLPNQHPNHLAFNVQNKSIYVNDPAGNTIEFVDEESVKKSH
jgi:catechol 2,3-dioxygenase-like lactoylglutathione lyase family enzyme